MTEKKTKQTLKVAESTELSQGVYSLLLEYAEGKAPREVIPGQFVGVYPKDASKLLPRPISICGWEPEKRQLRLVYRVAGNGTREFSGWRSGDTADILGILGNGYDVPAMTGKRVLLWAAASALLRCWGWPRPCMRRTCSRDWRLRLRGKR